MIYVVGKHTRTTYGPFASEAQAQAFIRVELRSGHRYYETAVQPPKAARKRACNGIVVAPFTSIGAR